jgi:23S rRNA (cytidine1920-2'-O)/16S rRNA (cytidine1409-2'-O)-methyltransferase
VGQRRRLDAELLRRQLVFSRSAGAELIEQRRVHVNGAIADKSSRLVSSADAVTISGPRPRFVSRGGEKLDAALAHFGVDVSGLRVLDAGASTGGFTDCCLQHGAGHVVALDVGHAQLHESIRRDDRVSVIERYNVRHLRNADIGGPVDLVVADLSFISLTTVLAALVGALGPGGELVLLVKPQFEAGRAEVSKGRGVIHDEQVHIRVRQEIDQALVEAGCVVLGWMTSPVTGASGNTEFLVHARPATAAAGR